MATILVADDHDDVRDMLRMKLTRLGHHVTPVSDGFAALTEARSNRMDLLILDVRMPGLSGLQVTRGIRADTKIGFVPIILLSADASEADRAFGYDAGANDYITKPFSLAGLGIRVNLLLASHPPRPNVA